MNFNTIASVPVLPQLSPRLRLQYESALARWVLLHPDGREQLNDSAAEILRRCDGRRTVADIVNNTKHVKVVEMEAAVLPRTLDDVDFAVINSNFAMGVGLNPAKDSLFTESKDSPYANVVAVRTGDNREALKKLGDALTSPAVKDFILKEYKGAVLPAF